MCPAGCRLRERRISIRKSFTLSGVLALLILMFASCDSSTGGGGGSDSGSDPTPDEIQALMLFLVNEARSEDRFCGEDFFPAAPPVTWDDRIEESALVHSLDMAENQYFDHIAPDGSNAGDRLIDADYQPDAWGENILVGLENISVVLDNWIESPSHCDVIMHPNLHELGVGMARGNYQGRSTLYWTMVMATESQ
jgi:uncharacterized protein YkwD